MQLIVFLGLLVGSALAVTVSHHNVTVYTVSRPQGDDLRYGPLTPPLVPNPFLSELRIRPFVLVYPGQRMVAVYVEGGFQGMSSSHPEYVHPLTQGSKYLVTAYPWQLPQEFVNSIPASAIIASAGHEQLGISQLAQVAAKLSSHPIILVQDRNEDHIIPEEQLKEIGTVQVTHDGKIQIVRDVVVERLQDSRYGAFFNPYGFAFQGYNTAYPFNYGSEFPYYGFQAQYPGYGYQGLYPSYPFHYPYGFPGQYFSYGMQAQYPFSALQGQYPRYSFQAQYPFYGFQGQYPSYAFQSQYPFHGFQGQYPSYTFQAQYPSYGTQGQYPSYGHHGQHNYGPAGKTSPTYPGYNCYQGYNGLLGYGGPYVYPGYGGPYLYPGVLGNPLGYNLVPSPYYYTYNPFFLYGQRNQQNEQQEQTTKEYSGYQYGSYPPFTLNLQQPQYQYGYQYQGYPTNYQAYPYSQPGAKSYQFTPYQFQEYQAYQYHPYQYQQYQPYHYPQYQPYQNQYYQHYQPSYGQYYPQ